MNIEWKCDKTAQIKAGIEPQEKMSVDLDLAALTPAQRELIAEGFRGSFVAGTQEEAVSVLAAELAARAEKADKERQKLEAYEEVCRAATIVAREKTESFYGQRVTYVAHEIEPAEASSCPSYDGRKAAIWTQHVRAKHDEAQALTSANMDAAREPARIKRAEEEKREQEAKAAELRQKIARRKETNTVEVCITRDDPREWGTPWGAVVSCANGRDTYDFDHAAYDLTSEVLTIRCKPGDVIAWGQKNYRKPRRTIHVRKKVGDDWGLKAA